MKKLGVNIDHIATVRNARGEDHPHPFLLAKKAVKFGADSITIHLREDRRHINDYDLKKISSLKNVPLNLEMAGTLNMLRIALKYKPNYVCIVPEKRKEITTEGGLNLKKNKNKIRRIINKLIKCNIRVSLFINPNLSDIRLAKEINSNCIELHTGKYCNLFNKNFNTFAEFNKIKKAANYAKKIGLEVHAGHGLNYHSADKISNIKNISELNIGHFIISESIFNSLNKVIKNFKKIINK